MATTFSFADRFSYPNANGVGGTDANAAQSLSDAALEALSDDLRDMTVMVKGYSVVLAQATTLDIFNTITTQTDPRISLILAAAKRREDNSAIFAGLGAIREVMFADAARTPPGTGVINRGLYSDGIRRVSAALAAAIIIGRLSASKEQLEHAKLIEQSALKDLEYVINTFDLSQQKSDDTNKTNEEEAAPVAFYFQPKDFTIPAEKLLRVQWQSPGLSSDWAIVDEYIGPISTWEIVIAIVDSINSQTVLNPNSTFLAVAELSGPFINTPLFGSQQFHTILLYPRRPSDGVVAYSINVKIEVLLIPGQTDITPNFPVAKSPFYWGPRAASPQTYIVNGCMILTRYNKIVSRSVDEDGYKPLVLYLRRKKIRGTENYVSAPESSILEFRVQPWQPNFNNNSSINDDTIEVEIPRILDADDATQAELDSNRYSQVAVALLNTLADLNIDTRVTGSIIRNDPSFANDAAAGLELIAWSSSTIITHVVLDILKVPADIEIAVGDRERPRSMYSQNPKSLRVTNPYSNNGGTPIDGILKVEHTQVLKKDKPRLWQSILDEAKSVEDAFW